VYVGFVVLLWKEVLRGRFRRIAPFAFFFYRAKFTKVDEKILLEGRDVIELKMWFSS
jgi:hypothetical protein